MERYTPHKFEESLYLTDTFDFPEWDKFKPMIVLKLSALFEERDNIIEDIVDGSASIAEWMDSMSVNSFDDLQESEKLLISLLSKQRKRTKKEQDVIDITKQILQMIKN